MRRAAAGRARMTQPGHTAAHGGRDSG
jgi:hypothetical protein